MPIPMKVLNADLLKGVAPGQWVAISADQKKIVAVGQTLQEVLKKAKKTGEEKPFILRIPVENSALVL